ncbi:MAG TPA: ferrochelatase [Gammaproteobacteria bacterium]|nr:ferrochelatase [Gammaproteobacteria bacterium]
MTSYAGPEHYKHTTQQRIGVLLVNLGTPDAATTSSVRRFLAEFLADPRIVEMPRLIWWLILHGILLRIRPRKVAKAYQKIWGEEGSPLLVIGRQQEEAVQRELDILYPDTFDVELAMRYGKPSIRDSLDVFRRKACRCIVVLPLFPQYSATTSASVIDEVGRCLRNWRLVPELRTIMNYHDDVRYIDALAQSLERSWLDNGRKQLLLMSFHGIPQRYVDAGDTYYCECHKTARLLAEKLSLQPEQWKLVFQSRFGREPWLQPYLDKTLEKLPGQGVTSVEIVCPGFSADCLETLEEVAIQNKELCMASGGQDYHYIPALNSDDAHIGLLAGLVEEESHGWIDEIRQNNQPELLQHREELASSAGFEQ